MVRKLPGAISRVTHKKFLDAQKLSGWQCHDATTVFVPLVMVSLVGLRGQHTNIAASSDSGRIICNRRTVFVSVSLSLGGQTDNFYHNAPLYSLSVGKRIICSVSITTLHQTATLAAFPMSKPLNSVHTDIRCVSKKLSQNVLNMKILRWPIF